MDDNRPRSNSNRIPNRNRTRPRPEMSAGKRKQLMLKKKKQLKRRRLFFCVTTIALFILMFSIVKLTNTLNQINRTTLDNKSLEISDKFDKSNSNYSDKFDAVTNIAIYGVDEENDGIQRSDSIMIGTVDTSHKKLKITSLMRDSYVNIPEHGYDKLNHAYAYGGARLSIATINKNFDLNISDYIAVDFSELESIVDALGGVELDLTDQDIDDLNDYLEYVYTFYNEPVIRVKRSSDGLVHLNGFEALGYGRNRSTAGGDFDRTERQRNLMNAMFKKISSMGAGKLASLMTKLLPYVETSLSNSEILTLGTEVLSMGSLNLEQQRFPRNDNAEDSLINGIFYFTFDEDLTRRQIYEYIFNDKKIWETSSEDSTTENNISNQINPAKGNSSSSNNNIGTTTNNNNNNNNNNNIQIIQE